MPTEFKKFARRISKPFPAPRLAAVAVLWFATAPAPAPLPEPGLAAQVDDHVISIADVDAASAQKVERIRAALKEVFTETIESEIDAVLRAALDEPQGLVSTPISEADIERFQSQRPHEFQSLPRAQQKPAVRYLLEQRARLARKKEERAMLRKGHRIVRIPPEGVDLSRARSEIIVARIDDQPVRAEAIERRAALRLYRLRAELYRERARNLESQIDSFLLDRAARKRKITRQLLEREIEGEVSVTDEELEALAKSTSSSAERVRPYLEFQQRYERVKAFKAELRRPARIQRFLREPPVPVLPIDSGNAPTLGPASGPRLIFYSNLRCKVCPLAHAAVDELRNLEPDVRISFRDFIPTWDPGAHEAARMLRCAEKQGGFEGIRAELLRQPRPKPGATWFDDTSLKELLEKLPVDEERFRTCVASPEIRQSIRKDTEHAISLGFSQEPAYIAEGVPLSGMQDAQSLQRALATGMTSLP